MKKTLLGSVAAGAVALGLIGGGTFAAWSDFDVIENNSVDAGHVLLNAATQSNVISGGPLAPGGNRTIDFFVASADLEGVAAAALTMQVTDLVDLENGCVGNSEVAVDATCAAPGDSGEFSDEAYVRVRYSNPAAVSDIVTGPNSCTAPSGYVNAIGYTPPSSNDASLYPRLDDLTSAGALGTLADNQGVCVRVDLGLESTATNAVQGDSATFDVRFNLEQIIPTV